MNKTYFIMSALLAVIVFISGCNNATTVDTPVDTVNGNSHQIESSETLRHAVLNIEGMYCASCGPGLARMFLEMDSVLTAKVSNKKDNGEIIYDASKTTVEHLISMLPEPYKATIVEDMPATKEMIDSVNVLSND